MVPRPDVVLNDHDHNYASTYRDVWLKLSPLSDLGRLRTFSVLRMVPTLIWDVDRALRCTIPRTAEPNATKCIPPPMPNILRPETVSLLDSSTVVHPWC